MLRSRICGNHAQNGGGAYVLGGGQYDEGRLNINYSTFSGNTGGALYLVSSRKNIIANSTISGNDARQARAIVYMGVFRDGSTTIVNSTISGNTSEGATVAITGRERSIVNSTIAFNQHTALGDASRCQYQSTVSLSDWPDTSTSVHIESTIAANNFCAGNPAYDIGSPFLETELLGANNLITLSRLPLPPDTISADPRLAPLASNGGRTKTHALLDDSPAIDAGNNAAGLVYDQRGQGYPRVKGLQADIGAYER